MLVPSGDGGPVTVSVVQGVKKSPDDCVKDAFTGGCIVARRVVSFVEHSSLTLPITLDATCLDIGCSPTETCEAGECVPIGCAGQQTCGDGGANDAGSDAGQCPTGKGDCNGSAADGCEADLTSDSSHCGACGQPCSLANAASACVAKTCAVTSCTTGYFDCDGLAATGCEVDLATDANNCGACGKACALGCDAGFCTPEKLVSAPKASSLAIDGESVYFVDGASSEGSTILKMAKNGANPVTLVSGEVAIYQMTVSGSGVYWTNRRQSPIGNVSRIATTGGQKTVLTSANFPMAVGVDGTSVIYTTQGNTESRLWSVPTSGGSPQGIVLFTTSGGGQSKDLAISAGSVFVAATSGDKILRAGTNLSGLTTLASSQDPDGIVVDGSHVYFTGGLSSSLKRVGVGGGAVETLAAPGSGRMATDGDWVYYCSKVSRWHKVSKVVEVLSAKSCYDVAVDATHVYWTSQSDGAVYRLPK